MKKLSEQYIEKYLHLAKFSLVASPTNTNEDNSDLLKTQDKILFAESIGDLLEIVKYESIFQYTISPATEENCQKRLRKLADKHFLKYD